MIEAVVLTEAVVGFAVRRRMVESASTVVLAEPRRWPLGREIPPHPPALRSSGPRPLGLAEQQKPPSPDLVPPPLLFLNKIKRSALGHA